MLQDNLIQVHPSISWLKFDDSHLQIRVPDGQNITLEECADEVEKILKRLSQPLSYQDTIKWAASEAIEQDVLDKTLVTLNAYSIIVESESEAHPTLPSLFKNVLDFNINSSKALRSGLPFPYFTHIEVEGEGSLTEIVRQAASDAEQFLSELAKHEPRRTLRIVCSTNGNQQFLREKNKQAVRDKTAILFVQWQDDLLQIGPLHIPGESACYECLTVRRRASSNFLAELDGALNYTISRAHPPVIDRTVAMLVGYALDRYLHIVGCGMFHLIKPNEVETWDIIKAQRHVGEVLKVPRCDVCGRKKSSDPVRAIRDLNS